MKKLSLQVLNQEFDRQIAVLLQKDYPKIIGISEGKFLSFLEPLRKNLDEVVQYEIDFEKGYLPFVIVIKNDLLDPSIAMNLVDKDGKKGVTVLRPLISQDFKTIPDVVIPLSQAYLLLGIDRGKENVNLPPNEAIKHINLANRSPLTIAEGIAIITHFPDFLIKNNCFSLLASRTGKDQRVPAIWINGKKEPNLGWCWDGNPHTWLGSASSIGRAG